MGPEGMRCADEEWGRRPRKDAKTRREIEQEDLRVQRFRLEAWHDAYTVLT